MKLRLLAILCVVVGIKNSVLTEEGSSIQPNLVGLKSPLTAEIKSSSDTLSYSFAPTESFPLMFEVHLSTLNQQKIKLLRISYSVEASNTIVVPQLTESTAEPRRIQTLPRLPRNPASGLADLPFLLPPLAPSMPCAKAFFAENIDLYGRAAPGIVLVTPRVPIPPQTKQLTICAAVVYQTGTGSSAILVGKQIQVAQAAGSGRYWRYRDGMLRRHIAATGRYMQWTWLKEYEPGRDPDDLLYHSRTMYAPSSDGTLNGPVKVYVPWVNGPGGSSYRQFGDWPFIPHPERAGAIFYGYENPLLHGGLAMAALSLEYLQNGTPSSLESALKLYEHIKLSEWHDQAGRPTGFYLRSRFPGDSTLDLVAPYFTVPERRFLYASCDELVGMTLGLVFFDQALQKSGNAATRAELNQRVRRLGAKLKRDFFFIVPPPGDSRLLQVRQKGWSGTFPLEWFFVRAFRAITGANYATDRLLTPSDQDWERLRSLPWDSDVDDTLPLDGALVDLELPALARAILATRLIGAWMYSQNGPIDVTLSFFNPYLPPGFNYASIDIGLTMRFLNLLGVEAGVPSFEHFNYPMILHSFIFGMEGSGSSGEVSTIKSEIGQLIDAIVTDHSVEVEIPLKFLLDEYVDAPVDVLLLLASGWVLLTDDVDLRIGTRDRALDYYGAAISARYGLQSGDQLVWAIRDQLEGRWNVALPLSQRHDETGGVRLPRSDGTDIELTIPATNLWSATNPQGRVIGDHNPPAPTRLFGSNFVWEKNFPPPDSKWLQNAGGDGGDGVHADMLAGVLRRNVDLAREGGGLDWLLPTALVGHPLNAATGADVRQALATPQVLQPTQTWLAGCVKNPLGPTVCTYPWPVSDQDALEPNDFFETAKPLGCQTNNALSIDRSTLYGRNGRTRKLPAPVLYGTGSLNGNVLYSSQLTYAWPSDDYDYFQVSCNPTRPLVVRLFVTDGINKFHRLVVDGVEAIAPVRWGATQDSSTEIEVPAAGKHVVKVTGDAATYKLSVFAR